MPYKLEMHAHTAEVSPCAQIPAAEVVKIHKNAGYHGLVITDHFNKKTLGLDSNNITQGVKKFLAGYEISCKAGNSLGIDVFLGAELLFNDATPCEYLVYGLMPEMLEEMAALLDFDTKSLHAFAQKNGAAVFQAHPFRKGHSPAVPARLDGIEVHNGNPRHNSRNDIAVLFAEHNGLLQVSGSDFHQEGDASRGGIWTETAPKDSRDIVKILRQNSYNLILEQV